MKNNNHGGARSGGGRKSKAEEYKLIDELDKQRNPKELITAMFKHIDNGSEKMLEKYLAYRFGMPKQMIESITKEVKGDILDLSKLSDKELIDFQVLHEKLEMELEDEY